MSRSLRLFLLLPFLLVGVLFCWWWLRSNQPQANPTAIAISGSMEPTLPGPIQWAECPRCGLSFGLTVSALDTQLPVKCIHCGSTASLLDAFEDPWDLEVVPMGSTKIEVGQIVVFEMDDENVLKRGGRSKGVKRVAGIPGDRVEVRHGDLWVNDRMHQKSMPEFLRQAIVVDSLQDSMHPSPRWKNLETGRLAKTLSDLTIVEPNQAEWFGWDPQQPVQDDFWMNQGERLHPISVEDRGLLIELRPECEVSSFDCILQSSKEIYAVRFEWTPTQITVVPLQSDDLPRILSPGIGDTLPLDFIEKWPLTEMSTWLAFAVVDGRVLLGSNGFEGTYTLDLFRIARPNGLEKIPSNFFRLRSNDPSIQRLTLLRDIQYRASTPYRDGEVSHGLAGFTLLGDNVAISDDSRTRFPVGVESSQLRGIVVPSRDPLESIRRQIGLYYRFSRVH